MDEHVEAVQRIQEYIEQNLPYDITMADLAPCPNCHINRLRFILEPLIYPCYNESIGKKFGFMEV